MDLNELLKLIPTDISGLATFLTGIVAFSLLLSWGYERWAWFQALTSFRKKRVVLLSVIFLPVVGWLLAWAFYSADPVSFPPPPIPLGAVFGVWAQFVWTHLLQSLLVYAGTQYAHAKDPAFIDRQVKGAEYAAEKHRLLG